MGTITQNLEKLVAAKSAIAAAITAKGGTVGANDGFEEFAIDVATIPSGGSANIYKSIKNMPGEVRFEEKSWSGYTSFSGYCIWTDGDNIYYSAGTNHYVLDKSTSTWSEMSWSGLTRFDGGQIWTDGNSIYYSYSSSQSHYVLQRYIACTSCDTQLD